MICWVISSRVMQPSSACAARTAVPGADFVRVASDNWSVASVDVAFVELALGGHRFVGHVLIVARASRRVALSAVE